MRGFDGRGEQVWAGVASGAELYARLRTLPGYGDEKAKIFVAILGKRMGVLDHIAQEFEVGHPYTEAEANEVMRSFHDDHATLRCHLVENGFLERRDGRYWRSGGTA